MLLITGALDPVTPPRFAEAVAAGAFNTTVVIVPGMAHAGAPQCVDDVVSAFIARGSMQGVDYVVRREVKPPKFITR